MSRAPRPPVLDPARRQAAAQPAVPGVEDAPAAPPSPASPTLPTCTPTLPPTFAGRPAFVFTPQPPVTVKKRRRSPLGPILLVLVVVGGGFAAYTFVLAKRSDDASTAAASSTPAGSVLSPVATGPQTALGALPLLEFERPPAQTAEWTEIRTHLSVESAGAILTDTTRLEMTADFVSAATRIDVSSSSGSSTVTAVQTPGFSYEPGAVFGAPWTRRPAPERERPVYDPARLLMYGDFVSPAIAATATGVSSATSDVDGRALTTYTFTTDLRDLSADGPFDVESTPAMHPGLHVGTMQVTIDDRGLAWRWQFTGNESLLRAALAPAPAGSRVQLGFGGELRALDAPVDVQLPVDFVDAAESAEDLGASSAPTAPGSLGSLVDQAIPHQSDACTRDQHTLEVATQAFMALHAAQPTEAELVPAYLASESLWHDLVDGVVVAAPGSPCT